MILLVDNGFIGVNNNEFYINGNTEKFTKDFVSHGVDVNFLQFSKKIEPNENLLEASLNKTPLHVNLSDKSIFHKLLSYAKLLLLFLKHLKKYDFYYVFFPGNINYILLLILSFTNKKYGLYVRGEVNTRLPFFNKILKKARIVVTNNPVLEEILNEFSNNVKVVISYKNLGNILPIIDDEYTNETLKSNFLDMIFVGRVEERKGVLELIDACEILSKKQIEFKLTIVGGGDLYNDLVTRVNQNDDLTQKIEFTGLIKDQNRLQDYYKQSNLFVFPSHTEGFPRVIFDAMLNNLPILTTFVGGIPGFMEHGYNCLEINVKDPISIADKILELNSDYKLRTQLSENTKKSLKSILKKNGEKHFQLILNTLQ